MNRRMNHTWIGIVLIAVLLIYNCIPAFAAETNKQVVRVAYFDLGDYYKEVSDGKVESYDTAFLNKIEKYSNYVFEYVNCGTWANALKMLENHEVDLVGTAQWTYERELQYEFCLESYGYTVAEIAGLKERNFVYEDYDEIGKSVIGCTGNYVRMDDMKELFKDHGISPTMKYYDTQAQLENALESGQVDLIAANSHTLTEDYAVIEKFTYSPFYLVSWKGNTKLTDQIDNAIISINLREPNADDALMIKYFPSIMGAPLTKEELDLIGKNKTYDVYFDASTKPISWYDKETGTMQGGIVEVCKQISKSTGLKLNPVPMFAGTTKVTDRDIRTTTVYNGVNENLLAKPGETDALLDESFNFYYKDTKKLNLSKDAFTVAIVANRVHLKDYVKKTCPNATVLECPTPADCLNAVSKGKAELTYLDCRIAENALTENGIEDVKEFPIEPEHQGIAILFPEEDRDLLVSIVNKGLKQVDQADIADKFVQYALDTQTPVTAKSFVRDNLGWIALGGIVLFLMLIGLAILFTYAKVMKKQKDAITKADADRTEFFGRMSHDMRTPMNGILGMIDLSEDTEDMDEIRENLHNAKAAGNYMLSLINDTLDLQRIESKRLELEKDVVHVADYYDSIFSILKISAEQKELQFEVKYIEVDLNNYIELDAVRVKQILSNLISNAIKFTPEGGAVQVIVESVGEEETVLHRKYQVRDTGVGMSQDFIDHRLFKPYSQENNQLSSELTGSGLGMAITKNLVELMDGRLEVESAIGEGTTYTVYLDIKRATKEEVLKLTEKRNDEAKSVLTNLCGKRILLCEDHPLNAEIAKKLLAKVGCIVEWAENGKLGVEVFEKSGRQGFDAILMDIRMPVMDGLEATKEIRKLDRADAKTISIIAMTANAYESDIQNCMDAGMNAHLAKPVNPRELYRVLNDNILNNM